MKALFQDGPSPPAIIAVFVMIAALSPACSDNGRSRFETPQQTRADRDLPEVDLDSGRRRLTPHEEDRYVSASAAIVCLPRKGSETDPPQASPEVIDYAVNVVLAEGFALADFCAISVAYENNDTRRAEIAQRAKKRCGRADVRHLSPVAEGIRLRRVALPANPLPLSPEMTRYVEAARGLACMALREKGREPMAARAKILADHGFDEASFTVAGRSFRGDPRVVSAIVLGVRQCEVTQPSEPSRGREP